MIAYTRLVSENFEKAAEFYDVFLAELKATRIIDTKNVIAWSTSVHATALSISRNKDGAQLHADGHMVAFTVDTPEEVDALFNKALALGASIETPVSQLQNGFYSGYLKDLDGHKLRVFCITA